VENQEENQVELSESATADTQGDEIGEPVQERRGFIKFLCAFIGTLISVMPFGAGVWAYLDPLAKREDDDGDGFIKVTTLDAIPADGSPAKFSVVADKVDAWNRFTNVSIGAVYLRLVDGCPRRCTRSARTWAVSLTIGRATTIFSARAITVTSS